MSKSLLSVCCAPKILKRFAVAGVLLTLFFSIMQLKNGWIYIQFAAMLGVYWEYTGI